MSDSELKELDELISDIQNCLWPNRNEHLTVNDLTKKDGLVKLFHEVEKVLIELNCDWYVKPSLGIDEGREKSQLYSDFANHLFRESDRKKFGENPVNYYNDNSKLPRWEFWAATCKALELPVTQKTGLEDDDKDSFDSPLEHELIKVNWEDLVELNGSENSEPLLNLGDNYPTKKLQTPRYQRPRRWTSAKQIIFVESLKSGYPIPLFFVYNDVKNNRYDVLDGQQRIHALIDTKPDWQSLPLQSQACVFVISSKPGADERDVRNALVNLYRRLNTGGVNLKPIEVLIAVFEDKPLLKKLIQFSRKILSTTADDDSRGWKGHMSSKFMPKKGGQSLLGTEENYLQAHELDLLDTLFRPLVYGTIDDATNRLKYERLTTMKGIEQLLMHPYSEQECESIIERLDTAFRAAFSTFDVNKCFLRMAKGRDESGEMCGNQIHVWIKQPLHFK